MTGAAPVVSDTSNEWLKRPRPWSPPEYATPEGVVGVGGDLRVATLLRAYSGGVFPWFNEGDPVIWWSPDPRAVLPLDAFHVPRRLAATVRQNRFRVTVNTRFAEVIRGCAGGRAEGTWLTEEMIAAYIGLHRTGHAHSVEAWDGDELAGGVYGVAVGGLFAAESMFYRVPDASKVALVKLVERLNGRGFQLLDVQIINDNSRRFGAVEIPRAEYLTRLRAAIAQTHVRFA